MKSFLFIYLLTFYAHAEDLLQQSIVVRATIQKSLLEIRNIRSEGADYQHADYEQIKKNLLPKIENQLLQFESAYQKDVIAPVQKVIANYKAVEADTQLHAEERAQLLDDLFKSVQVRATRTIKEFKSTHIPQLLNLISDSASLKSIELKQLQNVLNGSPNIASMIDSYKRCVSIRSQGPTNFECNFSNNYYDNRNSTPGFPITYEAYFTGCWTRGCQNLLMLTYRGLLELVQKLDTAQQLSISPQRTMVQFANTHANELTDMENKLNAVYQFFADKELSLTLRETELAHILDLIQSLSKVSSDQACKNTVTEKFSRLCQDEPQLCQNQTFRILIAKEIAPSVYQDLEVEKEKIIRKVAKYEQEMEYLRKERNDLPSFFLFDSKRESLEEQIQKNYTSQETLKKQLSVLTVGFDRMSRLACFLSQEMP